MSDRLPSHPDFAQLRRLAKDLRRAHARGEPDARRRVAAVAELSAIAAPLGLAQAQLVVAREHGFPSWAKLKHHLEHAAAAPAELVARFCAAAFGGDAAQARHILRAHPRIVEADLAAACAAGAVDVVRRLLRERPGSALAEVGPNAWTPLLCLCWSSLFADGRRSADAVAIARALLACGADANAAYVVSEWPPEYRETALAGACAVHGDAALARVLLAAGARPDDDTSFSNAIGRRDLGCLEALVDHGLDLRGRKLQHQLDSENPAMLRWLLVRGADPDVGAPQETALHWAINAVAAAR